MLIQSICIIYYCTWRMISGLVSHRFCFFPALSPLSDAVSDVMSVFSVLWLFPAALHHRCKGQTHQRHGVSCLLGARHQWSWTPQQLLFHTGYSGTESVQLRKELAALWMQSSEGIAVWATNITEWYTDKFPNVCQGGKDISVSPKFTALGGRDKGGRQTLTQKLFLLFCIFRRLTWHILMCALCPLVWVCSPVCACTCRCVCACAHVGAELRPAP